MAYVDIWLTTFRDSLSIPSPVIKLDPYSWEMSRYVGNNY